MTYDLHIKSSDDETVGGWAAELARVPLILDRQAELEAIKRAKGGDEMAQEKLIRSQIRWIAQLARGVKRPPIIGIDELISLGAYELIRCLAKFDESKGLRLSSFCERSIKGVMWRYVHANDGAIRIPDYVRGREKMRKRLEARGFGETGGKSSTGARHEDRRTLGEWLADTLPAKEDETSAAASVARDAFLKLFDLAQLSEQERRAFTLVFLSGGQDTTRNAGRKMNISRETTRIYVARAWRKMQAAVGAEATPVPYEWLPRPVVMRKGKGAA